MVSDRVGDFIVRLQNAARIGKREVTAPYSAHLYAIAQKLRAVGFLADVRAAGEAKKALSVTLAYDERGAARLRGVKRISKPGRRVYTGHQHAHTVAGGTGVRVLSTSRGVLSDAEARRDRVGGEELFEIW